MEGETDMPAPPEPVVPAVVPPAVVTPPVLVVPPVFVVVPPAVVAPPELVVPNIPALGRGAGPVVLSIPEVLRIWGVDLGADGVAFPLESAAGPYVPDALLHNLLAPSALAWCGPANRLGAACLLQTFSEYPVPAAFATARAVVARYHYAVLFVFGQPRRTDVDAERNAGLQAILFHPGRGETSRVHFRWAPHVQLAIGEIGDALHAV